MNSRFDFKSAHRKRNPTELKMMKDLIVTRIKKPHGIFFGFFQRGFLIRVEAYWFSVGFPILWAENFSESV